MYVRLAFAVAAHIDPEILIVDEVLAVGDAAFQKKCLGKMEDVSKGGRTVLFVSHNMPMIRCLTNKIMLLKNGRMAEFGGATSTIEKYLTENNVSKRDTYELLSFPRSAGTESAISKAWMESSKSATISEIAMGKFIRICFEFKLKESKRNILLGFGIENSDGLRIFSLNNVISNNVIEKDLEEGVAVFEIPELPLLPGTYFVSMSIVEAQGKWIDFIERAFSFNVIPDDVFGSGRIIEKSQGVVFVKGKVFNEVKIAANGHTKT
jgi:lipopolysaccharide transport system ATP-binding protein